MDIQLFDQATQNKSKSMKMQNAKCLYYSTIVRALN